MTDSTLAPIQNVLKTHGLDAVAFVPGPNFQRLFDTNFHLMERPLVVIVPETGSPAAIVPHLEMASFEAMNFPSEAYAWTDENGYPDAFAAAAAALPHLNQSSRFGLEAQRMRVFEQMALQSVFPKAQFVDAHGAISSIRLTKTNQEIEYLRKAIEISEAALEATVQQVRIGQTEKQIEAILMNELFSHGADGLAFEPIVAAGDNAAQPSYCQMWCPSVFHAAA